MLSTCGFVHNRIEEFYDIDRFTEGIAGEIEVIQFC